MSKSILSDADLKAIKTRSRKRFTDEQIEVALAWMRDNPTATLNEAAAQHKMTAQTLGFRRDKLLEKRGITPQSAKKKK